MTRVFIALTCIAALLSTGCLAKYELKQGIATAYIYTEDGPNFQSYLYISRDSEQCTHLEAVGHQYTRRPAHSRVGPYRVEANGPIAVKVRGINAGHSYATTCDVIFTHSFRAERSYLLKITEEWLKCGVQVFDITDGAAVEGPLDVDYRIYEDPAFAGSPACARP